MRTVGLIEEKPKKEVKKEKNEEVKKEVKTSKK